MTRVIHIDELSHPSNESTLFAYQHLSLILLVTMFHPNIHNKDDHYSLSEQDTLPYLSLAINYRLKIKRNFLSHLTHSFSIQCTFRERRHIFHFKYFLQIYPLKFGGFKKKQYLCTRLRKPSYSHQTEFEEMVEWSTYINNTTHPYQCHFYLVV